MKTIDTEYLKSLNPCADSFQNWLTHYKDWSGSLNEFLDLEEISFSDKAWVYFSSIAPKNTPLVAADIAESVLHIFEEKFPNDDRPRKAIEAARSGPSLTAAVAADSALAAEAAWAETEAALATAWAARAAWPTGITQVLCAAQAAWAAWAAKNDRGVIAIMKKWAGGRMTPTKCRICGGEMTDENRCAENPNVHEGDEIGCITEDGPSYYPVDNTRQIALHLQQNEVDHVYAVGYKHGKREGFKLVIELLRSREADEYEMKMRGPNRNQWADWLEEKLR